MFFVGIFSAHDGFDVSFIYSDEEAFKRQNDFRIKRLCTMVYAETKDLLNGASKH